MCDPFCKHPAFLAKAILTLLVTFLKLSIELHLSLAYGAFQNLRNMPQEHIDDFFAAYKHLQGRRHIN